MFESLHIQNFQSHRNTLLEFDKGLNIIFGISLNGKTAIARSMGLVIYNRPSGCKYYSNFAPNKGQTLIELKPIETNSIILKKLVKRKEDKTKALENTIYEYDDNKFGDEDGGVGKNVPDIIKAALNISELNIQRQFDQPFLILSSAGEFARVINRVTKLDKVDQWISSFASQIRKTKNEVELLETQSKEIELELKKYVGFENLESEVKKLQKIDSSLVNTEMKFRRIDSLLEKIEGINQELDKINPALAIEKDILVLISLETTIISLNNRVILIDKLKRIDSFINGLGTILEHLKGLETIAEKEGKLSKLNKYLETIKQAESHIKSRTTLIIDIDNLINNLEQKNKLEKLDSYLARIEEINNYVENQNAVYNKNKDELLILLKDIKECPVFGLECPATEEMIERVKGELK